MTSTLEKQSQVSPKKPERIFGQITNLLYLGSSDNLQAIAVQDEKNPEKVFLLGVDIDEYDHDRVETVMINNLNSFEAKFQKVFDNESYISIKYTNNQISSIAIVACLPVSNNQENSYPPGLNRSWCCVCCNHRCC